MFQYLIFGKIFQNESSQGYHDADCRKRDHLLHRLQVERHHGRLVVAAEPLVHLRQRHRAASQSGLHRKLFHDIQVNKSNILTLTLTVESIHICHDNGSTTYKLCCLVML